MPSGLVKTKRDEELWSKAKSQAAKQGHTEDWAYVNGIYQKMKGHTKKTASLSLLNGVMKNARDHPITEAEENAKFIKKDPSNPFALLYEDKKPAKVTQATKDMRKNIQDFFKRMEDWNKKYIDLAAGDTAVWDRIFKYVDASMRLGWKDVLEETSPLKKEARFLSSRGRKQVAEKGSILTQLEKKAAMLNDVKKIPHIGDQVLSVDMVDPNTAGDHIFTVKFDSGHELAGHYNKETIKKGKDMSKRGSILDGLLKKAGVVPGVPDATGPHGRGAGPGKGTKSGLGLVMAKMEKGEKLTEEEKAILEAARGKIK